MRLKELQEWLTPTDAARRLPISRQAVNKRLHEGTMGQAVYTRAGWLIAPGAVEDLEHEYAARETLARVRRGEEEVVPWEEAKREINEGKV